jgi:hypothetical protein
LLDLTAAMQRPTAPTGQTCHNIWGLTPGIAAFFWTGAKLAANVIIKPGATIRHDEA